MARRQGKAVELSIVGADTLIDQAILEQLKTPLTHLIRNAFDHGIESSASRIALEKPATGRIQLSATLQGTQLSIAIADDGRGIDLEQIFQQGVERGLFTPDQRSRLRRAKFSTYSFSRAFPPQVMSPACPGAAWVWMSSGCRWNACGAALKLTPPQVRAPPSP